MNCKICDSQTKKIFGKRILKKYEADYFQCSGCGFIQTSEPVWLQEAYSSAITQLDIGLLDRNIRLRTEVTPIIDACFGDAKRMLDYAGGYGIFVRLMRDAGFNFYRQDIYCENIFAKHFDISDTDEKRFDIVTAFEVFEHLTDPMQEIASVFEYSENIIFSTELYDHCKGPLEEWWYLSPETGQHTAFYSEKTLRYLAERFGKKYYCKNGNVHVFTDVSINKRAIDFAFNNIYYYKKWFGLQTEYFDFTRSRPSLLASDYEYLKKMIS